MKLRVKYGLDSLLEGWRKRSRCIGKALTGQEKLLGPENTSTVNTINNLGNLYCKQGRLVEAE